MKIRGGTEDRMRNQKDGMALRGATEYLTIPLRRWMGCAWMRRMQWMERDLRPLARRSRSMSHWPVGASCLSYTSRGVGKHKGLIPIA